MLPFKNSRSISTALFNNPWVTRYHWRTVLSIAALIRLACVPLAPERLLRLTREVRRVIGAAASLVHRDLRVRAQRARAIHLVSGVARRHDRVRGFPFFHPLLDRADHVEAVRAIAASAMRHPRNHEQPV